MTTTMNATTLTDAQSHFDAFSAVEHSLPCHDCPVISRVRRAAIARFGDLGFPSKRNEDWKFTPLADLLRAPMSLADLPPTGIRTGPLPDGVIVGDLGSVLRDHSIIATQMHGSTAVTLDNFLVALNTAFWRDGVFVYVPEGVVVDDPIELARVFSPESPSLGYRRTLIVLGRGAKARVSESFTGDGVYATNAVTEVILGQDAHLDHYRVQEESLQAFHLACTQAAVARGANFSTHFVGLGGILTRNEVRVAFTGEGAEATVNGMYSLDASRHCDNHTVIDHAVPHCNSHELYKGVLDGKSRGVFNGKIFVRKDAQKTDAKQTNQTLLLSDDATINTKPQLEIFADDVKCTHGATVGQLDEKQLFYLRSRGIPAAQARAMLTFAFANDIVGRIKVDALRERLERALLSASGLPGLSETEVV